MKAIESNRHPPRTGRWIKRAVGYTSVLAVTAITACGGGGTGHDERIGAAPASQVRPAVPLSEAPSAPAQGPSLVFDPVPTVLANYAPLPALSTAVRADGGKVLAVFASEAPIGSCCMLVSREAAGISSDFADEQQISPWWWTSTSQKPLLKFGPNGRALAVWKQPVPWQSDPNIGTHWVALYQNGVWTPAHHFRPLDGFRSYQHDIADATFDVEGNPVVVWTERAEPNATQPADHRTRAARLTARQFGSSPEWIMETVRASSHRHVDQSTRVVARPDGGYEVIAITLDVGGPLGVAYSLTAFSCDNSRKPQQECERSTVSAPGTGSEFVGISALSVSASHLGRVAVVWTEYDAYLVGNAVTWFRAFDRQSGSWNDPVIVNSAQHSDISPAAVALAGAGDAVVTWVQRDPSAGVGMGTNMLARRVSATNVAGPVKLVAEGGQAYLPMGQAPAFALNPMGDGILAWSQVRAVPGGFERRALASRYLLADDGFSAPSVLHVGGDEITNVTASVANDGRGVVSFAEGHRLMMSRLK
jgi:hypothetical protein